MLVDSLAFDNGDGLAARVLKLHGSINWREFPDDPLPRRVSSKIIRPPDAMEPACRELLIAFVKECQTTNVVQPSPELKAADVKGWAKQLIKERGLTKACVWWIV